jgi:hypothetical protein
LQDAWRTLRSDSPNLGLKSPEVRLVRAAGRGAADVRGVLKLLFADLRPAAVRPNAVRT